MEYVKLGLMLIFVVSVVISVLFTTRDISQLKRHVRLHEQSIYSLIGQKNHLRESVGEIYSKLIVKREVKHTGQLTKAKEGDSGYDLHCTDSFVISPNARLLVPTGVHVALPEGFEAQVRPRSGLANKYGITVGNSPGTIDEGYRGEIKVILVNHGNRAITFEKGDRIAQLVIAKVAPVYTDSISMEEFIKLPNTDRKDGGFGSTGK